jgi:hypothetical protein
VTEDEHDPLAPPLPPVPSAAPTRRRPRVTKPSTPAASAAGTTAAPVTAPVAPSVPDAWAVLTRLRPLEQVVAAFGASAAGAETLAASVTTFRLADGPVLVDPAQVLAACLRCKGSLGDASASTAEADASGAVPSLC